MRLEVAKSFYTIATQCPKKEETVAYRPEQLVQWLPRQVCSFAVRIAGCHVAMRNAQT